MSTGTAATDRERVEKVAQRVTERLQAAAVILGEEITGQGYAALFLRRISTPPPRADRVGSRT